MPFKHNASRRDKFEKARYWVTNRAEYNESLRRRGDVTVWFSQDAVSGWSASHSGKRGAQRRYSDLAIEACLTLRVWSFIWRSGKHKVSCGACCG